MIPLRGGTVRFRDRKWNGGCQGLREGENGELLFNGHRAAVLQEGNFLESLNMLNVTV